MLSGRPLYLSKIEKIRGGIFLKGCVMFGKGFYIWGGYMSIKKPGNQKMMVDLGDWQKRIASFDYMEPLPLKFNGAI